MSELINSGTFDDMVELASELATDEGGLVVVHKKWCSDPQEECCPCQPAELTPYSRITEADTEGTIQ